MSLVKNAGPYGLITDQATPKTTPVDDDSIGLSDSADSGFLKKLTWANLKATLIATAMTWTGKQTFSGGAAIAGTTAATAAGDVGEVRTFVTSTQSVGQAYKSVATHSVPAGKWLLTGFIGGSSGGEVTIVVGTTLDSGTGDLVGSAQGSDCRCTICHYFDVPSETTYYVNAYRSTGTANFGNAGRLRLVRQP